MDSLGLTLTIESARTGQEHVNLNDFLFQLSAFKNVLSSTESLVAKEKLCLIGRSLVSAILVLPRLFLCLFILNPNSPM